MNHEDSLAHRLSAWSLLVPDAEWNAAWYEFAWWHDRQVEAGGYLFRSLKGKSYPHPIPPGIILTKDDLD